MRDWKLTKRGEFVRDLVGGVLIFVALYVGSWAMWALLNLIVGGK